MDHLKSHPLLHIYRYYKTHAFRYLKTLPSDETFSRDWLVWR